MTTTSLDAVQCLNGRIFATLSTDEQAVLDFFRAQGRKYEVRVEIENNADPAELARTRSQAQADQVLKSANSVVRVTIGAGDPAAWSARAAHAGLAIWANTAVKSLDNMQDRTGFEP